MWVMMVNFTIEFHQLKTQMYTQETETSTKIHVKSDIVTISNSVSYKVVSEKVLNWTSKGR